MSLFGALDTAISGLTAQSAGFANISNDVANSQTVGFKRVETSFSDYLTTSSASVNDSGAVVSLPKYMNNVQGTIGQTDDTLGMAISGQGFFPVSVGTSTSNGVTTMSPTPYYTRAGDFQMNKNGYIVNSAGNFLNGWTVDPTTGVVNQNAVAPIQINQSVFNPVPTSTVTLAANLPATPSAAATVSSQTSVYDSLGTAHDVTLNWTQNAGAINTWTLQIVSPNDVNATPTATATDATGNRVIGSATVVFGNDGTIQSIGGPVSDYGTVTTPAPTPTNNGALVNFTTQFTPGVTQAISLNLGNFGAANGVTQFAGTTYSLRGLSQNGVPPGSFNGVTTTATGGIVVNYNNGQSRTIAQVPLVTFNNPNGLQAQNGQAYSTSELSGNALASAAGTNGAGNIVTGSIEQSNVDIATEFTKLIVTQQAYTANTKIVTTANQLLQVTIEMKA